MVLDYIVAEWRMLFVFALVVAALVLFITEWFPIEITSLVVLVALASTQTLEIEDAFSGFSNRATLTVLMMFILSAGIVQSGIIDWLSDRLKGIVGSSTTRQILIICLIVGPVSAFINNTAAVAVMIPLVTRLANQVGQSPSKLLLPLSFAAMLGGTMTLIGTSTNLLASSIKRDAGLGAFGMFEFTQAGALVFLVGLSYLILGGHRLVPARLETRPVDERYHLREFIFEARVPEGSPLIDRIVGEAQLVEKYETEILEMRRGKAVVDFETEKVAYKAGDRLMLNTTRANLQRMVDVGIVVVEPLVRPKDVPPAEADEQPPLNFSELLVHHASDARGKRLGQMDAFRRQRVHVVALLTRGRPVATRLYHRNLKVGDVILVQGQKRDLDTLTGGEDFHVLGGPETPLRRPHKIPLVLLILLGVVGLAALEVAPIVLTATAGAILMVLTGALRIEDMYRSIHWDVIFLLAGIIPLGLALTQTGGAALVGQLLANVSAHVPPLVLLALVYLLTTLLTEIISNNAAVVLIVPIVLELTAQLGYNPVTFILAAMFAASTSFLTPVGYQTNLLVMGPGAYRYGDYFRVGAPLNLLMLLTTPLILNHYWPIV